MNIFAFIGVGGIILGIFFLAALLDHARQSRKERDLENDNYENWGAK